VPLPPPPPSIRHSGRISGFRGASWTRRVQRSRLPAGGVWAWDAGACASHPAPTPSRHVGTSPAPAHTHRKAPPSERRPRPRDGESRWYPPSGGPHVLQTWRGRAKSRGSSRRPFFKTPIRHPRRPDDRDPGRVRAPLEPQGRAAWLAVCGGSSPVRSLGSTCSAAARILRGSMCLAWRPCVRTLSGGVFPVRPLEPGSRPMLCGGLRPARRVVRFRARRATSISCADDRVLCRTLESICCMLRCVPCPVRRPVS
jgi:hypothetical protein